MDIHIHVGKWHLVIVLFVLVLLAGLIGVIAFGGSQPSVMGHSLEEVQDAQQRITGTCSGSEFIQGINSDGSVVCGAASAGSNCGQPFIETGGCRRGYSSDEFTACSYRVCNSCGCTPWNPIAGEEVIVTTVDY